MRTLIDKIVLTPVCRDGKETLSITLHGDLAGILGLATNAKGPLAASDPVGSAQDWLRGHDLDFVHFSWRRVWRA